MLKNLVTVVTDLRAWSRSLLFSAIDTVYSLSPCPSATLLQIASFFVSRWNPAFLAVISSGALKMQDMKMQDLKLTDQYARHEIAGYEIAGHENAGHEIAGHAKAKQITIAQTSESE